MFGFRLIMVFNPGFGGKLSESEQYLHLAAIALVGCGIALVMGPAAFHRQDGPRDVTLGLVAVATKLLLWSMFPLMLGITLDFYLIARVILQRQFLAMVLALAVLTIFVFIWILLPRSDKPRRLFGAKEQPGGSSPHV